MDWFWHLRPFAALGAVHAGAAVVGQATSSGQTLVWEVAGRGVGVGAPIAGRASVGRWPGCPQTS